ncbi:MAG: helix-turn-helix transcriptional regulator [Clostridia bacterium]|nr:helix-turn-helix transcriptional regulator [Clostridia bacterium]
MSIGQNIRKIRENAGISQTDLAEQIGIGKSMLAQIERGTKAISLPLSYEITKVLKCSLYDLIGKEN